MKNDLGVAETMVLFAITFSLVASSFCVSWIVNDYATSPPCPFGSSCAPIQLAWDSTSGIPNLYSQDYTNTSGFDNNLTFSQSDWLTDYGEWTQQDGVGYVLTSPSTGFFQSTPLMLLDSILPENGHYIVNYGIDNAPAGDYAVYPRISGVDAKLSQYTIKVKFSSDGVHVRSDLTSFEDSALGDTHPDLYFFPLAGAQETISGGSTITTDYVPKEDVLAVSKDGVMLFSVSGINSDKTVTDLQGKMYHGGVSTNNAGFILKGTSATRAATSKAGGFSSLWSGLVETVANYIPGAAQVLQISTVMLQVIAWTLPEAIFPLWLNVLLIKTQVIIILYLIARLARGGG
jgi:hypothetical protein